MFIDMENQKQWWAPVWKGLIMDQKATHYQRMKNALWLYLYLLLNADRRTGVLKRKTKTISIDTGIKERTIRKWLSILKNNGYIETRLNGRCLYIQIKKWKGTSGWQDNDTQTGKSVPVSVAKVCQSVEGSQGQNPQYLSQESPPSHDPNDITIKRDILNIDIDDKYFKSCKTYKTFNPKTREELLALDLAEALEDIDGLPLYLSYAKKYPEGLLRQVLGEVKEIPADRIKKSRGALFNYMVQKCVQRTSIGDIK